MTEMNGEAISIRQGGSPATPQNLSFGPPSECNYYGVTGEIREQFLPRPQRPGRKGPAQRRPLQPGHTPESRSASRAWWKNAQKAVEEMAQAASRADTMQVGIAANELDVALAELWKLRASRDINWQTILNHVQGMLRQAFAEKRVEELTTEQCVAIQTIVDRHLGTSNKSVDDLNEAVSLIESAGFDPYAAISGDPLDGPGQERE